MKNKVFAKYSLLLLTVWSHVGAVPTVGVKAPVVRPQPAKSGMRRSTKIALASATVIAVSAAIVGCYWYMTSSNNIASLPLSVSKESVDGLVVSPAFSSDPKVDSSVVPVPAVAPLIPVPKLPSLPILENTNPAVVSVPVASPVIHLPDAELVVPVHQHVVPVAKQVALPSMVSLIDDESCKRFIDAIELNPAACEKITKLRVCGKHLHPQMVTAIVKLLPQCKNLTSLKLQHCVQPDILSPGLFTSCKDELAMAIKNEKLKKLTISSCRLGLHDESFWAYFTLAFQNRKTLQCLDLRDNNLFFLGKHDTVAVADCLSDLTGLKNLRLEGNGLDIRQHPHNRHALVVALGGLKNLPDDPQERARLKEYGGQKHDAPFAEAFAEEVLARRRAAQFEHN